MDTDEHRLNAITERIIGSSYAVANALGHGFLEKVYHNALAYELRSAGLTVETHKAIEVRYRNEVVGDYIADLVVEVLVLVELKAVKEFDEVHMAQCLNYLKATGLPICILINFGAARIRIKRIVSPFYPCSSVSICGSK
ncbi:MAG: GxxExxY protein [Bryobacteraceae bacterium]